MMKRLVPHSASPCGSSWAPAILKSYQNTSASREERAQRLAKTVGRRYCTLTTSGRYSIYLVLKAVSELAPGKEVIVPAYTCPSVIKAVIKSGLIPVFCDLKWGTFDYNFPQLNETITPDTAAVIAVNLCGQVCNYLELETICRRNKLILIEDACQSLGSPPTPPSGRSQGIFSVVSFGFSKNLALGRGGAVFTDDPVCHRIVQENVHPAKNHLPGQILFFLEWFAYQILLRPRLYYLLRLLPFSLADQNFHLSLEDQGRMPDYQAGLLVEILDCLPRLTASRLAKARLLHRKLSRLPHIQLFSGSIQEGSAALRFPILAKNTVQRNRMLQNLRRAGIEADPFYDLNRQGYFQEIKKASPIAAAYTERIFTIPTHPYLTASDINLIFEALVSAGIGG